MLRLTLKAYNRLLAKSRPQESRDRGWNSTLRRPDLLRVGIGQAPQAGGPLKRAVRLGQRPKGRGARAKADAWAVFSRMIRTRDCLATTGTWTHGRCCTCGREYPFKRLQAGHWTHGRHNAVLFDERNVHAQCVGCNRFKQGAGPEYSAYMLAKHGQAVMGELLELDKTARQYGAAELREMAAGWATRTAKMMMEGSHAKADK